jgi:fumarate reductase flavoprotein subunit
MKQTYDVIVVGAGGSGLAAAHSAAERGARVLVLEKQAQLGGTTGIAVGSFTSSGTTLQAAAGIEDDAETHAADAGKFAPAAIEARNSESMRAFFLREAAATFEWLRGLGLSFVGPSPEPPNQQPRMHNVVPGAKAYIATFQMALARQGATLQCNAAVESLLRDGQRVAGVSANVAGEVCEYRATRGVILAAGDYANNAEMIAAHKGEKYRQIDGINPFACGDGHRLASGAGAKMLNMDVTYGPELRFVPASKKPFQQSLPAHGPLAKIMGIVAPMLPKWILRAMIKRLLVTWQHPENSLFDDGAILLNRDGERFVDETSYPDREIALAAQPGKIGYILLDERLIDRYSRWPNFISTAPDIAYAYVADYQRLRPDVTHTGANLADVSQVAGVDGTAVAHAVASFNAYVDGNREDTFGRTHDQWRLAEGRCVLLGPLKAYFTTTEGGAVVTERMEVLDEEGEVIPGLYAVGQNGLSGMILWSHGLHIAWAMTSGRLAGAAIMNGFQAAE